MQVNEIHLRYPDFKIKAITLSYDDGTFHDKRLVEIFNRYELKCTFNLNAGTIEGSDYKVQFEEIPKVYKGHEIAAHSFTHPHLEKLNRDEIAFQVIADRYRLEDCIKKPVTGFAYPYGLNETEGMIDTIKNCGIEYARTVYSTHHFELPTDYLRWNPTCHHADPKLKELVKEFLAADENEAFWSLRLKLLYVWGHSVELEGKWDLAEEIFAPLSGHENVWYATNIEIIDYLEAFKNLKRSLDGRHIYNNSDKTLYFNIDGTNHKLNSGDTLDV